MKLAKEECVKALNALYFADGTDDRDDEFYGVLLKLINEQFDNPPLSLEEIKEGDWVWYKPLKQWKKIYRMNPDRVCFQWIEFDDGYVVDFEPNRFYRKQVKE